MNAPRVFRNTALLLLAQVLVTPVVVLVNAIAARTLGSADFGRFYQALTFTSFVFLLVEWGQPAVLTAKVAIRRSAAGELLGSALAIRLCAAVLAGATVPFLCLLAGYDRDFVIVVALAILGGTFATLSGACQDVVRGFERMDFAAASYVGWQFLSAAAVVPTLLLGGGLRGLLIAQGVCAAVGAVFMLTLLPRMSVPKLSVRFAAVQDLLRSGRPFLVFGLVLMLQPLVDAALLSRFAPAESLGWYAAARKLVGALTFPAVALVASLYPVLCRLHVEDRDGFRRTAADALSAVAIGVVPIALGCALFPELGVAIFGQSRYGPAQDDLRVLAPYILLVYLSMPIGSCLVSSGRQVAWTVVQFVSVLISAGLDPPLIRWFQAHAGNGGLGVCVATVVSEILMLSGGLWLLPEGILRRIPRRPLACALLSGAVMAATAAIALSVTSLDALTRAILAVLAYVVSVKLCGGVNFLELRSLMGVLRRR
jgi:O-antigen/teichoic acid export membrane protein